MTGPEPDDLPSSDPSEGAGSGSWPSYQPPDANPGPSPQGEPTTGWGQPAPNPYGPPQGQPPTPPQYGAPPPVPGQQPYGYSSPGGGQPRYGAYTPSPPNQPQATTALVLGLISVVGFFMCVFPALLGPVAAVMGYRSRKEIEASNGTLGGGGSATAGLILGIIASVLIGLILLIILLVVGLGTAG